MRTFISNVLFSCFIADGCGALAPIRHGFPVPQPLQGRADWRKDSCGESKPCKLGGYFFAGFGPVDVHTQMVETNLKRFVTAGFRDDKAHAAGDANVPGSIMQKPEALKAADEMMERLPAGSFMNPWRDFQRAAGRLCSASFLRKRRNKDSSGMCPVQRDRKKVTA